MKTQEFTTPYDQVASLAMRRGVRPFWAQRLHHMASHASIVAGTRHGDNERLPFTSISVTGGASWPLAGSSIILTRQDGRRFMLGKHGSRFTVVEVAASPEVS
jgi:hypothetical protein